MASYELFSVKNYENASNKSKEATENSNFDAHSESKNFELNYLLNESVDRDSITYQQVPQVDPDTVGDKNEMSEKTFNFICIEFEQRSLSQHCMYVRELL